MNPTPIRITQPCYSCKGSWEPDHRCKGKDQERIIEAHHDSDDEVCGDGVIDVDSEQSGDDNDSCTEASDSDSTSEASDGDSCTEASDACTLEEDSDPWTLEEQLDGQDDSTGVLEDISHTIDDPMPLQSGDTSEDSHVLSHTDEQLPMVVVTHLPYFHIPMIAKTYEDSSTIEEPYMQDAHHGCVDPLFQEEVQDIHTIDFTHTDQHEEIES
jgi:hypothetical protein